ncbi:MAG: hypothetical protein OEN02_04720 [Gammaproteobacteria bacterium]|nr:hypothetical protein [Gammaproteobacteria bacterium]MDH3537241.1 hypothetical protein [Gammaproteobacteria bacterium]
MSIVNSNRRGAGISWLLRPDLYPSANSMPRKSATIASNNKTGNARTIKTFARFAFVFVLPVSTPVGAISVSVIGYFSIMTTLTCRQSEIMAISIQVDA